MLVLLALNGAVAFEGIYVLHAIFPRCVCLLGKVDTENSFRKMTGLREISKLSSQPRGFKLMGFTLIIYLALGVSSFPLHPKP